MGYLIYESGSDDASSQHQGQCCGAPFWGPCLLSSPWLFCSLFIAAEGEGLMAEEFQWRVAKLTAERRKFLVPHAAGVVTRQRGAECRLAQAETTPNRPNSSFLNYPTFPIASTLICLPT